MTLILSGTNGLSDVDGDASTPAIRGTDANTGIFFGTDIIGFSEGGTEAMRINADAQIVAAAGTASLPVITTTGDVNTGIFFPAADTIAFTTGGTTRGRWTTDGLCFNADTAAANALDDYEEGTFTPVYSTSGGGESVTHDIQQGVYVKVGSLVYFALTVRTDVFTGGSGNIIISLPFTAAGGVQQALCCGESAAWVTNCPSSGFISNGTTVLFLLRISGTGTTPVTTANIGTGSNSNLVNLFGCYRVS